MSTSSNSDMREPLDPVEVPGNPRAIAFTLVPEVVGELTSSGRDATGSEVRLALKDRTYGGFDPKALGFRRFRDFLDAAGERGLIEVDRSRRGDVGVRLPGHAGRPVDAPREVRGDLWRAFVDWGPDELRLFDTANDRVIRLPKEPAPLEPEKFSAIRRRLVESPQSLVAISPVSREQLGQWMREFASSREPALRELLVGALDGEKPAKTFLQIVKGLPEEHARWNDELLLHVRPAIERWREANGVAASIEKSEPTPSQAGSLGAPTPLPKTEALPAGAGPVEQRPSGASPEATRTAITAAFRIASKSPLWSHTRTVGALGPDASEDVDLRQRLHAAIDRMPVDELRKIVLPVGYLFGR